jgi:hypothetical protein
VGTRAFSPTCVSDRSGTAAWRSGSRRIQPVARGEPRRSLCAHLLVCQRALVKGAGHQPVRVYVAELVAWQCSAVFFSPSSNRDQFFSWAARLGLPRPGSRSLTGQFGRLAEELARLEATMRRRLDGTTVPRPHPPRCSSGKWSPHVFAWRTSLRPGQRGPSRHSRSGSSPGMPTGLLSSLLPVERQPPHPPPRAIGGRTIRSRTSSAGSRLMPIGTGTPMTCLYGGTSTRACGSPARLTSQHPIQGSGSRHNRACS